LEHRPAVIEAAIVDEHELVAIGDRGDAGGQPGVQRDQAVRASVHRDDHAQHGHRSALWKNTSSAFGVRWKYSGASAHNWLTVICRGRSSTNRPTTQLRTMN